MDASRRWKRVLPLIAIVLPLALPVAAQEAGTPVARPAEAPAAFLTAELQSGNCSSLDSTPHYGFPDLPVPVIPSTDDTSSGGESVSVTTIQVSASLDDLIADRRVVVVFLNDGQSRLVACTEIRGTRESDSGWLYLSLREVANSGYTGIVQLTPNDPATLVTLMVQRQATSLTIEDQDRQGVLGTAVARWGIPARKDAETVLDDDWASLITVFIDVVDASQRVNLATYLPRRAAALDKEGYEVESARVPVYGSGSGGLTASRSFYGDSYAMLAIADGPYFYRLIAQTVSDDGPTLETLIGLADAMFASGRAPEHGDILADLAKADPETAVLARMPRSDEIPAGFTLIGEDVFITP